MPDLRVFLVEDYPIIREAMTDWLSKQPGFVVVGQASSLAECLAAGPAAKPDIILLDLMLEGGPDGIELVERIRRDLPDIRLLVFSLHDEKVYAERVLRAGAHGYIMKREPTDDLLVALRTVAGGDVYLSRRMSAILLRRLIEPVKMVPPRGNLGHLSDRELQVFQLIGSGLSLREIAARLGLSLRTVETHRENIKNKLSLQTSAQVVREAALWLSRGGEAGTSGLAD